MWSSQSSQKPKSHAFKRVKTPPSASALWQEFSTVSDAAIVVISDISMTRFLQVFSEASHQASSSSSGGGTGGDPFAVFKAMAQVLQSGEEIDFYANFPTQSTVASGTVSHTAGFSLATTSNVQQLQINFTQKYTSQVLQGSSTAMWKIGASGSEQVYSASGATPSPAPLSPPPSSSSDEPKNPKKLSALEIVLICLGVGVPLLVIVTLIVLHAARKRRASQ